MSFAESVIQYFDQIAEPTGLPEDVEVMNPFKDPTAVALSSSFYRKFYGDKNERVACFGINPGRFGGGITGVPFTDPIKLKEDCGIDNELQQKPELSSRFIYDMINAYGGPHKFYARLFITAVSPLGFLRNGINLNYYDIKGYKALFEEYVKKQIEAQIEFGISQDVAFSIGKGENIKYLNYLNNKYQFFKSILPLSHPRWVMQYRLKRKEEFIEEYLSAFANV